MNNQQLGPHTKQAFDEDGFIFLNGFLSPEELSELSGRLDHYVESVVPRIPSADKFFEDKSDNVTLKQLIRMHHHDSYFDSLLKESRFTKLARLLLGGEVTPKGTEYFNKPPRRSQPTPPHQDGYYFMIQPCEAITFWIPLEEVDEENGCLRYVRGSHRLGLRSHNRTQTLGFSQGIVNYPTEVDQANEVPFCARPGDVLGHHAATIHRADGNASETRSRRALGLVYYSAAAQEDHAAQKAYEEQLHRDLSAAGKI